MSDVDDTKTTGRSRGGFSLASLALLVTVCVAILTAIDIDRCHQELGRLWTTNSAAVVGIFLTAAIVGGGIGLVRLIFVGFSVRMLLFAPLAGSLVAVSATLILIAPGPLWRSLLAVGLLLTTTHILRLGSE